MEQQPHTEQPLSPELPLTCQQATELLLDYVTGELAPAMAEALERHLSCCKDCVAFLNTYRSTIRTTRSLPYETLPAEMQAHMLTFLQDTMKGRPPGR